MASVWGDIKRRKIFQVAAVYMVVSWLIIQIVATVEAPLSLPDWVDTLVIVMLAAGFPLALIFTWAFQLTPDGIKRDKDVERSASDDNAADRRLGLAIIVLLVVALSYFAFDKFAADTPQLIDAPAVVNTRPSIAVLPFVNMSSDPEQEYFSDGLSEEILNLLVQVPELKVIGRTSSFAFKGKNEDLRVIGEKLGANTVLEGSVRKSGDQIRITAQLIDVSDGTHLWSGTYDRTMADIFAIQDDVAAAIIGALQVHIVAGPTRERPTDNAEAYTLFLKARTLANEVNFTESKTLLLSAVGLDPEFAEAHELMARAHWDLGEQQPALDAAARALAINPDLVMAQAVHQQASVGTHLAGIEAFEKAVRRQPDKPLLMQALEWNLIQAGYLQEAIGLGRRLVDVDPLSPLATMTLSNVLYADGQDRESNELVEIGSRLRNKDLDFHKGAVSLFAGQDEQAIAYYEAYLQQQNHPDTSWVRELITQARDPVTGEAFLDRRIAETLASTSGEESTLGALGNPVILRWWYLCFGFIDRYFDIVFDNDPSDSRWTNADNYLYFGIMSRRSGFTAHPRFLEVAETMGLTKVWEKRGPPDLCDKADGKWVCE